jgi:hypothetical protein
MSLEPNIQALVGELKAIVDATPERSFFNPGASKITIALAESQIGTSLPASFKEFLRTFNGGFISIAGTMSDGYWDKGTAEWNSNFLFGTDRLHSEFLKMKRNQVEDFGEPEPWLYIPFCHTEGQELLVFGPVLNSRGERAVLDAFHESGPNNWRPVYPTFAHLLADYVARNGEIETIGSTTNG